MSTLTDFVKYIKRFFTFPLVFVAIFLSLDWFVLDPYVTSKYTQLDLVNYEDKTWISIAYIFSAIGLLCMAYISIVQRSAKEAFGCAGVVILLFLLLFGIFNDTAKKVNLAVNTWFETETLPYDYKVSFKKTDRISLRSKSKDTWLYFNEEIEAIKAIRKEKNLPALETLQDGDTINVMFAKGYLDIKYLK